MAGKRALIDTSNDKRYVRRGEKGQFDEVTDVGRSSAQDQKRDAKTKSKPGQGEALSDQMHRWRQRACR
jgi:hypothetical protein